MNFKNILWALLFWVSLAATINAQQQRLDEMIDRETPSLLATYKMIHAAPELSGREEKTSALVAKQLRAMGYTVTERVGKYENQPWTGYGVVAVLKNGTGPTVLVRADMDALPVEEKTGLAYASKVKTKNDAGQEVSVMHACGHDIHITSLLGTAKMLAQLKDQWSGTLVLIGQPAEEAGGGAKAMLNDGLYTRFPKPDYVLALHDDSSLEAGKVGYIPGYALASWDSVDITIRGVGGHGSRPESAKDPIVIAAQVILALQMVVSREKSPFDPAVVTIGSIHGGTKHNIIPDDVHLQLTVRTYKQEVRKKILASIERITKGVALAAGVPTELEPIVKVSESGTATYNDPALTARLAGVFEKALGAGNVVRIEPIMGSEDVGYLSLEGHHIPLCFFRIGATAPEKILRSKQTGIPVPGPHSSLFAPLPEPTIKTGVKAMTSAVLELMKK